MLSLESLEMHDENEFVYEFREFFQRAADYSRGVRSSIEAIGGCCYIKNSESGLDYYCDVDPITKKIINPWDNGLHQRRNYPPKYGVKMIVIARTAREGGYDIVFKFKSSDDRFLAKLCLER